MDNMYMSQDDSQDPWRTQQLGPATGQARQAQASPAGPRSGSRRGARRGLHWGIGIAAAAMVLCGSAAAAVALTGGTSPAGLTANAAALNTAPRSGSPASSAGPASAAVSSAAEPASGQRAGALAARCRRAVAQLRAAGRPTAARALRRGCQLRELRRLRFLAGIGGQVTFETKSGPRTLAFARGVIESASGTEIVVRATDGTTSAWSLAGHTVVRANGKRAARSSLTAGERVFVGGPVTGGANDARLIIIRHRSGASGTS